MFNSLVSASSLPYQKRNNSFMYVCVCIHACMYACMRVYIRAGKNLRFFKKRFRFSRFLGFLGFNVRTVARGTLDAGIRSEEGLYTKIN